MFKLIYVGNYRPQVGGASISCHQILRELARRGCCTRILASMTDDVQAETLAFDASASPLDIHRFVVPYYFQDPQLPAPDEWEESTKQGVQNGLEAMIAKSAPDVLLVRESWLPFANEVAARHRIPTIALVRGNPTSAVLSGVFPQTEGAAYLEELRKASRIVTVAQHFLPGLASLGFEGVQSIRNGVDLEQFSERERDEELSQRHRIEQSDIVVFHASQLKRIKRPLDIIQSAPAVLSSNPQVLYVILGEGEHREEMQRRTQQMGIDQRFRFENFVAYEQMPRYMSLADVVVMPSEREGQARVYLESMACGKTLIASDIPAAREVVTDGSSGLLFRKGDTADLSAKTLLAANDSHLRTRIGECARARARQHCIHLVGEQYMSVIRELMG